MTEHQAGSTPDQPLYFRWVRDDTGAINWGRVLLGLALTAAAAYVSVRTQRAASSPDFERSLRMTIAQRKITRGVRLQRAGKALEDAGWAAYEIARQ